MLKKTFRLSKNWEFQNVYRKGKSFSSQFFVLNFLPNSFCYSRLGIVVSKKTARKAVERNQLKRRLREMVVDFHKINKPGFDIIISVKPAATGADFQKLKKNLEEIFKKISPTR